MVQRQLRHALWASGLKINPPHPLGVRLINPPSPSGASGFFYEFFIIFIDFFLILAILSRLFKSFLARATLHSLLHLAKVVLDLLQYLIAEIWGDPVQLVGRVVPIARATSSFLRVSFVPPALHGIAVAVARRPEAQKKVRRERR